VYALDAASGSVKWQFATGGAVQTGIALWPGPSQVSIDDAIFFGSDDGFLYSLAGSNGTLIGKVSTYDGKSCFGLTATPVIALGPSSNYYPLSYGGNATLLIIGSTCGTVYLVQVGPSTQLLATYRVSGPVRAAAAVGSNKTSPYFPFFGQFFVASNLLYSCTLGTMYKPTFGFSCTPYSNIANVDPRVAPLAAPSGLVYVALVDAGIIAIATVLDVPVVMFSVELSGPVLGAMALDAAGTLYGNAQGDLFAAYTTGPIAGKINWRTISTNKASTNVILSNSTLIAGTWTNSAFGVCARGSCAGLLQWTAVLPQGTTSHLAASGTASKDGSRLFVGSLDYSVYCIEMD
jgi:outer membrane protein assembly factor BamB